MQWIILTTVIAAAGAFHRCPTNIQKAVNKCMEPVSEFTKSGHDMLQIMTGMEKMLEMCREDTLPNLFGCLNNLYNKCARKRENARELGLILHAKQWQSAITLLCNNEGFLRINARHCELKANSALKECFKVEQEQLHHDLKSVRGTRHRQPKLIEKKTDIVCKFAMKVSECIRVPYSQHCEERMTNLIVDVVNKFKPPGCSERELVPAVPDDQPSGHGRGPSYRTSHVDQHHDSSGNNDNGYGHDRHATRDEFVSLPGDADQDDDDFDDDDEWYGSENDVHQGGQKDNIFRGPGAAAQAKESDKDGTPGLHSVTARLGMLFAVATSTLAVAISRFA